MDILEQFPPNINEIRQYLDVDKHKPFFCYGNTLYNPFKQIIPEDILFHESIHAKQQTNYFSPDFWWQKYLMDREFRKEVELEAFARQYLWLKQYVPEKAYREALEDFSVILSSDLYDLNLNKYQARTLLSIKSKEYESTT